MKGRIGIKMDRNKAEAIIPTFPIAPSSSPQCKERLAPSICADSPIAKPLAPLLFIPKRLNKFGPIVSDIRLEIITKHTVTDEIPPRSFDIVMAIGRVTDLGTNDAING